MPRPVCSKEGCLNRTFKSSSDLCERHWFDQAQEQTAQEVTDFLGHAPRKHPKYGYDRTDQAFNIDHSKRARAGGGSQVEYVYRDKVWERDHGICGICGDPADPDDWQIDHIVALSQGGDHSYENVQVSHPACNRTKAIEERRIARLQRQKPITAEARS